MKDELRNEIDEIAEFLLNSHYDNKAVIEKLLNGLKEEGRVLSRVFSNRKEWKIVESVARQSRILNLSSEHDPDFDIDDEGEVVTHISSASNVVYTHNKGKISKILTSFRRKLKSQNNQIKKVLSSGKIRWKCRKCKHFLEELDSIKRIEEWLSTFYFVLYNSSYNQSYRGKQLKLRVCKKCRAINIFDLNNGEFRPLLVTKEVVDLVD